MARRLVEQASARITYLDVYLSSALRAGAPRPRSPDPNECAHFCMPGPNDDWNMLLFYHLLGGEAV